MGLSKLHNLTEKYSCKKIVFFSTCKLFDYHINQKGRHVQDFSDLLSFKRQTDCVNPNKRGGMDRVFQGLAWLPRGISRGRSPREILSSSSASPRKTPSIMTLLLGFTFYLKSDILVLFLIFSNTDV